MTFQVRSERRSNTLGLDPTIWIVDDGAGTGIEIWPAHGFNCHRWFVYREKLHEILFSDQAYYEDARPSRSGIPVLFPFPNRIRGGRFTWAGKNYQLPVNDTHLRNAIHGFACRHPWRVVDVGADESGGWISGEFQMSRDAPDTLKLWPGNACLQLTYRLTPRCLRIEAIVSNPGDCLLPFGLGYHPYFTVPFLGEAEGTIRVPAASVWQLEENLPSGHKDAVDPRRDLRRGQAIADAHLDDILSDLELTGADAEGLMPRGTLQNSNGKLEIFTSPSFCEMVVFTPPHRHAICLEPYTCITDAINLQLQGNDAGLIVLEPESTWTGVVDMRITLGK